MKNVMKKLAGLLMVFSFALLAGCSDSSDRANEAPQTAKTYTVSGKISIGNAVPASVAKSLANSFSGASANARTATTDFDMEKTLYEKTLWEVGATSSADPTATSADAASVSRIYGTVNTEEMTYSINLPEGIWKIQVNLYGVTDEINMNSLLSSDSKTIEVPENLEESFVLSPLAFSTEKNGALNLSIEDKTTGGKIKSVTCDFEFLNRLEDIEAGEEIKKRIIAASEKLGEPKTFSDGEVKIECNDIPAGCYEATFTFKDEKDNTLYECKEIITVFSGWTTDTWLGDGAHLKTVDEVTKFEITDGDIFEVENVPDTQMVLYEAYSEPTGTEDETTTGYKYYLNNSAAADITTTTNTNSFCFDSEGNFYAITKLDESATYITSNKSNFGTTNNPGEMYIYGGLGTTMAIDKTNDFIYMWDESNHSFARITALDGTYPKLTGDSTCVDPTLIEIDGDNYPSGNIFVINDEIAYIADIEDGDSLALKIFTVQINQENASVTNVDYLNLDSSFRNATITDMLYQDGAVYLLVREVSGTTSRGALIRYDVKFGGIKVLGLTDNEIKGDALDNVKLGVYYEGYSVLSRDTNEPIVFSGSKTWRYTDTEEMNEKDAFLKNLISPLRTPASLSAPDLTVKEFFGPVKFIAIKPKKLVIADDGIAFYTDNDLLLKYKNVNRIVTVDLESFSIIDEPSLVNVHFNGDISGIKDVISLSTTESQDAWREGKDVLLPDPGIDGSGTTLSYKNSINDTVDLSDVVFGIPCGD